MIFALLIVGIVVLALLSGGAVFYASRKSKEKKAAFRNRLMVADFNEPAAKEKKSENASRNEDDLAAQAAKRAADFYMSADPDNVVRVRHLMLKAGYLNPDAVGKYFLARFASMGVGVVLGVILIFALEIDIVSARSVMAMGMSFLFAYALPTLYIRSRVKKRVSEYRNGFPDFMDLMIVCSDAGLSMDASIDRVATEIRHTYPALSQNLALVSLELRAGRTLDETLKALADRLDIEEVRAFATLLKQSRELGTSLSGTLKVFSEEMRHKRMSAAEEKAHQLPAKMTIPVTLCILPTVLMMAIIPTIVRLSLGD